MKKALWQIILAHEFPPSSCSLVNRSNSKPEGFTPYQNNGGTVISISFEDFSILASDTRATTGFAIPSRETTRILKISRNTLLATSGMRVDMLILQEEFKKIVNLWEIENKKNISVSNSAYILSSILYSRRFFPYYTFNIISGKDPRGKNRSFSFDAVGSFESCFAVSSGTGQLFIQPILDSQFEQTFIKDEPSGTITDKIVKNLIMIKHLFLKASKRNIEIGDGVQIFVLTKKGILIENSILKCD